MYSSSHNTHLQKEKKKVYDSSGTCQYHRWKWKLLKQVSYRPRFSGNHDPLELQRSDPMHIVISSGFSNSNAYFSGPTAAGRCLSRNTGGTLATKSLNGVIKTARLVEVLFSEVWTRELERKAEKTLFPMLFWLEGCCDIEAVIFFYGRALQW